MLNVTILGCGGAPGVPMIGNIWGDCDPSNPKNRRTRASVFVQWDDTAFLIDCSPDLRQQLLREEIADLDAVLITHAHADHCHGIDELRAMNWLLDRPIDLYADAEALAELQSRFSYCFKNVHAEGKGFYSPDLVPHLIKPGVSDIKGKQIIAIEQDHGPAGQTLGFRIGNFAYSTDVRRLDERAFKALSGITHWVVDCTRITPHPTHSHLAQTLEWIEQVAPEQAILTHMNHELDYDQLCKDLPPGVTAAYDGMKIFVPTNSLSN